MGRLLAVWLALALVVAGPACQRERPVPRGSTLEATFADPDGDGALERAAGEPLIDRVELAPAARPVREIARFGQLSDAHVSDEESPARLPFLDRLGAPFVAAFRPQEALSVQVLDGAVRALNAVRPQAVVVTGDLVDNAQRNELDQALAVLRGAVVEPDSGHSGYSGVQAATNADPFYYRPDVDAPRHPGLLEAAQRPFRASGLRAPWFPVAGNHDLLVQGVVAPTESVRAAAVGSRAVTSLDPGSGAVPEMGGLSGWGLPEPGELGGGGGPERDALDPALLDRLLAGALAGRIERRAPDSARRPLGAREALGRLRSASGVAGGGALLDYSFDIGDRLRGLALDTARRRGGAGGLLRRDQLPWLAAELREASRDGRRVIVFTHHPLSGFPGGRRVLALLDRHPGVVACVAGHVHRNRVAPRRSESGGYWLISSASLADHPQQSRAFRLLETAGGGLALETWMIDHADPRGLGAVSRELAFLDAQGGRPARSAGRRLDRNVRLYVP